MWNFSSFYYYKKLWAIEASKHQNRTELQTKEAAHVQWKIRKRSCRVWAIPSLYWRQKPNVKSEKVWQANRDAVQRKLYQEIFMHLNDATLQMIIPQNNMKEFELWNYLQKSFGQIRTSQIIALW